VASACLDHSYLFYEVWFVLFRFFSCAMFFKSTIVVGLLVCGAVAQAELPTCAVSTTSLLFDLTGDTRSENCVQSSSHAVQTRVVVHATRALH
jgi:hypothetical protein